MLALAVARNAAEQGEDACAPDYSDVPNLGALRNPAGVAPTALPLTLRMLSHVPILVSSRRSQVGLGWGLKPYSCPVLLQAQLQAHLVVAAAS